MEIRKSPPRIEDLLNLNEISLDAEYDLAGTLGGVRGTWHRLWSVLSTQASQLFDDEDVIAKYEELGIALRNEFEEKLGRVLSPEEFDKLKEDAMVHGAAVKEYYSNKK